MCDNWTIDTVDPRDSVAMTLIAALTQELARMYHDEDGSGNFAPADVLVPRSAFLVGSLAGRPVACGAYRPMSPDVAEIKRMYVKPDYRGRGLGRRILHELELRARGDGYSRVRLETGTLQPEAIRLYERAGYHRTDCYGVYVGNLQSVCFEKVLA
jgi:GNAT superfamily N-acetyltransferase